MSENQDIDPAVAADLAKLMLQLSKTTNKKSRKLLAQAIREAAPDSPHAGAFSDVDLEDKFEAFERKQEKERIEAQQAEVLRDMNSKKRRLLEGDDSGRKYSEDDVKKIEALMQRKGITDYDDGAVLYSHTLPPANPKPGNEPPPVHGSTWEFPQFEEYAKNPTTAARKSAHAVIGEFMRKRA